MNRLKFTLLNLTATLIEYTMIFLLSYYLIRKQDLMWSLIDVGIILFIGLIETKTILQLLRIPFHFLGA